jgi:type IV pilus assembly protein PilQ
LASLDTGSTGSGSENEENKISEIFKIFYQTSADIVGPLTAVVGENVTITDDPKNNQLIVTASLQDLDKVDLTLQELDVEKKQVMIEAYIINATDNFTKAFNANLVTFSSANKVAGRDRITFTGISTNPSNVTEISTGDGSSENDTNSTNFPDAENIAGGAFLIGNLGITTLKAIIQASNTDSNAETISNPKLFAMDGETSTLVQGVKLLKVIPAAGDAA